MLIYNKHIEPLPISPEDLPIKLYGSGSKGNSAFIQPARLLIDIGLPAKRYEDELRKIDVIFLTHQHGDHLNLATLKYIAKYQPQIQIFTPIQLVDFLEDKGVWPLIDEVTYPMVDGEEFDYTTRDGNKVFVKPYNTKHGDLQNMAFDIEIPLFKTRLLYATDLEELGPDDDFGSSGLPTELYNLIMLEANYDKPKLTSIIQKLQQQLNTHPKGSEAYKKTNNDLFRAFSNYRHLSEEDAHSYVARHLTNGGIYIPLHASDTFGTYHQNGRFTS